MNNKELGNKYANRARMTRTLIGIGAVIAGIVIAGLLIYGTYMLTSKIIYNKVDKYTGLETQGTYPMAYYSDEAMFVDEYGFMGYEDEKYTYRRGIDVSTFQGEIDWAKVKESGVEFAIIRVGFRGSEAGIMYDDNRFEENMKGALANGIDVGVYFFSQAVDTDEAIEEAKYVLDKIKGYDITMPVCFDMEPVDGEEDRIAGLNMEEMTSAADAFCTVIANHGYQPIIYGNPSWLFNNINLAAVSKWPLWLAYYRWEFGFPYHYDAWQYSCTGSVDGIDTNVDLNIWFVEKDG